MYEYIMNAFGELFKALSVIDTQKEETKKETKVVFLIISEIGKREQN